MDPRTCAYARARAHHDGPQSLYIYYYFLAGHLIFNSPVYFPDRQTRIQGSEYILLKCFGQRLPGEPFRSYQSVMSARGSPSASTSPSPTLLPANSCTNSEGSPYYYHAYLYVVVAPSHTDRLVPWAAQQQQCSHQTTLLYIPKTRSLSMDADTVWYDK